MSLAFGHYGHSLISQDDMHVYGICAKDTLIVIVFFFVRKHCYTATIFW